MAVYHFHFLPFFLVYHLLLFSDSFLVSFFLLSAILTLRRLMSYIYIYIYGAPILDVSRSHTTVQQSVGLLWTSDQIVAETSA